jgi:hypothetical protein
MEREPVLYNLHKIKSTLEFFEDLAIKVIELTLKLKL